MRKLAKLLTPLITRPFPTLNLRGWEDFALRPENRRIYHHNLLVAVPIDERQFIPCRCIMLIEKVPNKYNKKMLNTIRI